MRSPRRRGLRGDPVPAIQVAGQAEQLWLVSGGPVAARLPDLRGVLAVGGFPFKVPGQHGQRLLDVQLCTHVTGHPLGHVRWIGEEGAQEPDRTQLQGEPNGCEGAAFLDQPPVLVVEVEEAGRLLGGGLARVAAVEEPLLSGEKGSGPSVIFFALRPSTRE